MSEYRNIFTDENGVMYLGDNSWKSVDEAALGREFDVDFLADRAPRDVWWRGVIELL